MSNSFHTILQILVSAGWLVIFAYSFIHKSKYLSIAQKILLPLVCVLFSIRYTTLFNAVKFATDWYSILYYVSEFSAVLLLAYSLHNKEQKMDELKKLQLSFNVFKAMSDNALRVICAVECDTNILIYSNNKYKKTYKGNEGEKIDSYCNPEYIKIYTDTDQRVRKMLGKHLDIDLPVSDGKIKSFRKFFALMDNKKVIITISNE